jgi:hypothetical protein
VTTPGDRVTREIGSFDAKSRQILTNGGTVRGGNGILYKYDPSTGMAVNANPAPARRSNGPARGPQTPAERAGIPVSDTAPASSDPRVLPPGSVTYDPTDNGDYVSTPDGGTARNPTPGRPVDPAAAAAYAERIGGVVDADGNRVAPPDETLAGPTPEEAAKAAEDEAQAQQDAAKKEAEDRQRRDAYARLQTVLNDYGLGSLAATVQSWLVEGLSEDEIVQRMRETPEFKTRFPAIEERKKKGLAPISPGEYVAYERQARQMMRAAGFPEGLYDQQSDFTTYITNDMSLSEMGDRVTLAADAAFKMPAEDREALSRWGLGPGDMTAYWLDPSRAQPMLERKQAAAKLSGAAQRSRFGGLDEGTATGLAQVGVTASQAEQGFGRLYDSRELFGSLDAGEDAIGQDEQIDAAFRGNAQAQRRIEQRRRRRQGVFEGGGQFATGQGGVSGLGDSQN